MRDFDNKHIWIIGASSGIGEALARELSDRGANLILSARRAEALRQLNESLNNAHQIHPLDVTDFPSLRHYVATLPKLDSIIFLAAIYAANPEDQENPDFIHKLINVNLGGAFNVISAIKPYFKEHKRGQIVLGGSVAGYCGLPHGQPYSATKAGILNLAESLKTELEPYGIHVQVINPGFVKTPMTDQNDFPMPMILSPEQAAKAIAKGLKSKTFEIHFPKKFTFFMKGLRLLPYRILFLITRRLRR